MPSVPSLLKAEQDPPPTLSVTQNSIRPVPHRKLWLEYALPTHQISPSAQPHASSKYVGVHCGVLHGVQCLPEAMSPHCPPLIRPRTVENAAKRGVRGPGSCGHCCSQIKRDSALGCPCLNEVRASDLRQESSTVPCTHCTMLGVHLRVRTDSSGRMAVVK